MSKNPRIAYMDIRKTVMVLDEQAFVAGVFKSDLIQMLDNLLLLCEQNSRTREYHHIKEIQKELQDEE